jgi:hypothetical protein
MSQGDRHYSLERMTSVALNDNMTTNSSYDPLLDPEDRYWGVSDRDVPILIGAAAGKQNSVTSLAPDKKERQLMSKQCSH